MSITHDSCRNDDAIISGAERNEESSSSVDSPDFAASNFYLLGDFKQLLARQEFPDGESLIRAINAILGIEKVTLGRVFLERMKRSRRYIETGGEYAD
jgi:hypothetical protein